MKTLNLKKITAIAIAFVVLPFILKSQHLLKDVPIESKLPQVTIEPSNPIRKQEISKPINRSQTDLNFSIYTEKYSIEHDMPNAELLEQTKKAKNEIKKNDHTVIRNAQYRSSVTTPLLNVEFEANSALQGTPPDNTIAVSNGGIIVSAINSNINYYDPEGTKLFGKTFYDFFNDVDLSGKIYDPVLYYDSRLDRFIFVVLHGSHSDNNYIIACFSKTNNPLDGWNIYKFKFYDLNIQVYSNKWLDFPRIGVSTNELFISGNIFYDNDGGFYKPLVIQINKNDGFAGKPLNYRLWDDIRTPSNDIPFTLVPISYGHSGNIGPGIYMVSNDNSGGSKIFLYHITNELDNNETLKSYELNTKPFELSADAVQKQGGTNPGLLMLGDCRILDGFYFNDYIHFVFHSQFNTKGYSGINYQRIQLSTMKVTSTMIGNDGEDFGFPTIVSTTNHGEQGQDVMIAYLKTSKDIYPGIAAVKVDNDFSISAELTIKEGKTYVDIIDGDERWGDYSCMQRKHNTSAPLIWLSGCFGTNITYYDGSFPKTIYHNYKAHISQISDSETNSVETTENESSHIEIFPNPVTEYMRVNIQITEKSFVNISIIDQQGRLVDMLFNDKVSKGETTFSFDKSALNPGIYYVVIRSNGNIIGSEKVVFSK